MKAIFFEWQDYEDYIEKKHNIFDDLDVDIQFYSQKFDINLCEGADIISIFVDSRLSEQDLDKLSLNGCNRILLRCAGFNMLNVEYAKKLGIKVCRVASYSPESIAEYVFALLLNLCRRMNHERTKHQNFQNGRTIKSMGFVLKNKTLGLYGYGNIAKEVAKIGRDGFGMKIVFFDPYIKSPSVDMQVESLPELFSLSDVVSIHVPLNQETKHTVNAKILENIKADNFTLINTARGEIIQSEDLIEFLNNGRVKYFGTDVWRDYDKFDGRLLTENTFQADHVAFLTEEAVLSILSQIKDSIKSPKPENMLC